MQINRLFEMVYLLLDKKKMTAKELAEHFEVSSRTIYRDVELLSSSGIPLYATKGKGGGIALLPDFVLNKTVLTDEEKAEVLSALHAMSAVNAEQATTALAKLSSLFGSTNSDWVEVDFSSWIPAEEEAAVFATLKKAVIKKQRVTFSYHSPQGSTSRDVEPLKLCFKEKSWYLYAYCLLRGDYRFFKLRRIKQLTLLTDHFERTAPLKACVGNPGFRDEFVTITLRFSKEMAYRVLDEFPSYEELPDGRLLAKLTMPRGAVICHHLASYGRHCEVLEPQDIRQLMKEHLENTLSLYA
ncbi:MAG: YafY family protein [Gordonibacter sp.]|uniref:helix-turn-helix transcriptional regulator n=1 Tax=Gordonibacter sp. TaxID=1968902 RepID=UPI002FC9BE95